MASSVSGLGGFDNKYGISDRFGHSPYGTAKREEDQREENYVNTGVADNSYDELSAIDLSQPLPNGTNDDTQKGYVADDIDAAIAAEMKHYAAGLNEGSAVHATLEEWERSLTGSGLQTGAESWVKRFANPTGTRSPTMIPPEGSPSMRRLPPSISQSFADRELVDEKKKKKKPEYGRPTLLHARDHDLYESRKIESSDSEIEEEPSPRRLSRTSPNKKEHPLREALRCKSDKLAHVKSSYAWDAPPLSKQVITSVPHRSPSPQRQHSRATDVPANKRYLLTPTDSSLAKAKRHPSARVAAARLPGDWH